MASRIAYSQEEWNAIKPVFLRLYLIEEKTLDEVREELEKSYNFVARKSFKLRIRKWCAFKNYKAREKDDLALQMSNEKSELLTRHGKPVKWDRVNRHLKGKTLKLPQHQQMPKAFNSKITSSRQLCTSLLQSDEMVLNLAKSFLHWQRAEWTSDQRSAIPRRCCNVYRDMQTGIDLVSHHATARRGWDLIHQSCHCISTHVPTNLFDVLCILICSATHPKWKRHIRLCGEIFAFIRGVFMTVSSQQNPFRLFMSRMVNLESFERIAVALMTLSVDVLSEPGSNNQRWLYSRILRCLHSDFPLSLPPSGSCTPE